MFERLQRRFRLANDEAPAHRRLSISDDGVLLLSAKSDRVLWSVAWNRLVEITAFKVDAYVVDHICLGFLLEGETTTHITDEETPGWDDLVKAIEARFGISPDWWPRVAFPAFAENRTVLWRAAQLAVAPDANR